MIFSGSCLAALLGSLYFCCPIAQFITCSLTNLIVGYLMAAFISFLIASPDLNSSWWYQLIFLVCIVAMFILFPSPWILGKILVTAAMGTYAIVQAFMFFVGTHSSYFIINSMRAISVRNYLTANTTPELGAEGTRILHVRDLKMILIFFFLDFWMFAVWLVLLISAVWYQCRAKERCEQQAPPVMLPILIDERAPLITRYTYGSDDVFESPETNNRFLARFRRLRGLQR